MELYKRHIKAIDFFQIIKEKKKEERRKMVEARKPTVMMMGNLGRGRKTTVNSVLSDLPEENFPQGQAV